MLKKYGQMRALNIINKELNMKKLLAIATLSAVSSLASAENYQFLGGLGYEDTDLDAVDLSKITAHGKYYFSGQETVGPLDQFSYIDDTTNIRANVESTDNADEFTIGGSYYFNRFAVGLDYTDFEESYNTRLHGDFFFMDNLKASLGYSMPEEGDDVVDLSLEYDHAINEQDYIGFTVKYTDTDEATVKLSTKYLNAFDNGQFLVLEANIVDADDTAFDASAKWYLNKNTGFVFGANDDDLVYIGATHFFNTNFALDATIGQDKAGDESYTTYGLEAVFQF